jgi:hypothetical protein
MCLTFVVLARVTRNTVEPQRWRKNEAVISWGVRSRAEQTMTPGERSLPTKKGEAMCDAKNTSEDGRCMDARKDECKWYVDGKCEKRGNKMGTVRNLAHDSEDINWDARKHVDEWSQRPAPGGYMDDHKKKVGSFSTAMICLGMAAFLVATWVLFI